MENTPAAAPVAAPTALTAQEHRAILQKWSEVTGLPIDDGPGAQTQMSDASKTGGQTNHETTG